MFSPKSPPPPPPSTLLLITMLNPLGQNASYITTLLGRRERGGSTNVVFVVQTAISVLVRVTVASVPMTAMIVGPLRLEYAYRTYFLEYSLPWNNRISFKKTFQIKPQKHTSKKHPPRITARLLFGDILYEHFQLPQERKRAKVPGRNTNKHSSNFYFRFIKFTLNVNHKKFTKSCVNTAQTTSY